MKKTFFNPHVGIKHNHRLILLATLPCPHENDCPYWERCTKSSNLFEDSCPFPNSNTGPYQQLSNSFLYLLNTFIEDKYEQLGEKKNRTYSPLTKAISLALENGDKMSNNEIWQNIVCNELSQKFTKQLTTTKSDFDDRDFESFLEMIVDYNIDRVVICGAPGFHFIRNKALSYKNFHWQDANDKIDSWFHRFYINDKEVIVIFSYHPSYSGFFVNDKNGNSNLVKVLRMFFSDDLKFKNI